MSEPAEPTKEPPRADEVASPPVPPAETGVKDVAALSPEEQMERFEDALKEGDWGHQPC